MLILHNVSQSVLNHLNPYFIKIVGVRKKARTVWTKEKTCLNVIYIHARCGQLTLTSQHANRI